MSRWRDKLWEGGTLSLEEKKICEIKNILKCGGYKFRELILGDLGLLSKIRVRAMLSAEMERW